MAIPTIRLRSQTDRSRMATPVRGMVRGVSALPKLDPYVNGVRRISKGLSDLGQGVSSLGLDEMRVARITEEMIARNVELESLVRAKAAVNDPNSAELYHNQLRILPTWGTRKQGDSYHGFKKTK